MAHAPSNEENERKVNQMVQLVLYYALNQLYNSKTVKLHLARKTPAGDPICIFE